MTDRLVTEREIEGILRRLNALETRLEREKSEVPIVQIGTWTPAVAGTGTAGTFGYVASSQVGTWTRMGDRCLFEGAFRLNAITVAPTGSMVITGLPFTSYNQALEYPVTFGLIDNFNYTNTAFELTGQVIASDTRIALYESFDNAAFANVPAANFTNANCRLFFGGHYKIA